MGLKDKYISLERELDYYKIRLSDACDDNNLYRVEAQQKSNENFNLRVELKHERELKEKFEAELKELKLNTCPDFNHLYKSRVREDDPEFWYCEVAPTNSPKLVRFRIPHSEYAWFYLSVSEFNEQFEKTEFTVENI